MERRLTRDEAERTRGSEVDEEVDDEELLEKERANASRRPPGCFWERGGCRLVGDGSGGDDGEDELVMLWARVGDDVVLWCC
jgi:hypothetical protein